MPDTASAITAGTGLFVDVVQVRIGGGPPSTALNTVSLGVYPQIVDERSRVAKRFGKVVGALVAGPRVLKNSEPFTADINGRTVTAWAVFIGVNDYSTREQGPLWRAKLDDGVLDVRILHAGDRRRAALSMTFLGGRLRRDGAGARTPTLETFHAQKVCIELSDPTSLPGYAQDGEATVEPLAGTVEVTMRKRGVRVYAPVDVAESAGPKGNLSGDVNSSREVLCPQAGGTFVHVAGSCATATMLAIVG